MSDKKISPADCALPVLSLSELQEAFDNPHVDLIEIYLDYIESITSLKELIARSKTKRVIFTSRLPRFANTNFTVEQKLERIRAIYDMADYFDFDIINERPVLDTYISHFGVSKLIASYHSYEICPSSQQIKLLVDEMIKIKAEIFKFAWLCECESDLEQMLELVKDFKHRAVKYLLSPMGSLGIAGRMILSFCGVEWIYCSTGINSTANGQITVNNYQKFLSSVGFAK